MHARRLAVLVPALFLAALVLGFPDAQPLPAQSQPLCVSGCNNFNVYVTPDGSTSPSRPANSNGYSALFQVQNNGALQDSYDITCLGSSGVTCTGVSSSNLTIASGAKKFVTAYYNVGSQGTGKLRLTAAGEASDTGWYNVPITAPQGFPGVALINFNRDNHDRSLCLTAGAGEAAAYQCGYLTVYHSMPGYTTKGRERSLSLVHTSEQAYPSPIVVAGVTEPVTIAKPDNIFFQLSVSGVVRDTGHMGNWGGGPTDVTRQVIITYNASSDSTGLYPISLLIRNEYGAATYDVVLADTLMGVNRTGSEFGAGWGLDGIEHLYFNQPVGTAKGDILLVDGDGSGRWYHKLTATTWAGPRGTYQDTLTYSSTTQRYTRTLRHGIQVVFDASGRHVKTVNRVGDSTVFVWSGSPVRLTSIKVPPVGQTGTVYTLAWDGNHQLDKITDPAGRVLDATVTSNTLVSLKDPDSLTTTFNYNTNQLISARTDTRGNSSYYTYTLNLLSTARLPLDTVGTSYATTTYTPWNWKFVDPDTAYTKILGPRPNLADDATFWLDKWGAPVKIKDALGAVTTIVRGNSAVPALATKVVRSNGHVDSMTYDNRGNLSEARSLSSQSGAPTSYTSYTYGDLTNAPDSPTRVTDALGRHTDYTYTSLGLTKSVTSPNGHTMGFAYQLTGLQKGELLSVTDSQVTVWHESAAKDTVLNLTQRFTYTSPLGNIQTTTAPSGVVTSYVLDAYGGIKEFFDPYGTHTRYVADVMGRVTIDSQFNGWWDQGRHPTTWTPLAGCDSTYFNCNPALVNYVPNYNYLLTHYHWSAAGVDTVTDPGGVVRSYAYGPRGEVVSESDEFGHHRTAVYDEAGLLTSSTSRSNFQVRFHYDLAGRRTSMVYPTRIWGVVYPGDTAHVAGDSLYYQYDSLGHLTLAHDRWNEIRRTYYANGALKAKRTTSPADSLVYTYDASGAVKTMIAVQGSGWKDSVEYTYDAAGALDSMRVTFNVQGTPVARVFTFDWDELGRRKLVTYPNAMKVHYSYDPAGALRQVIDTNPGNPSGTTDRFDFTYRNTNVDPAGRVYYHTGDCRTIQFGDANNSACQDNGTQRQITSVYSRLSALVTQRHNLYADTMAYDKSGNMVFHHLGASTATRMWLHMVLNSNRLNYDSTAGDGAVTIRQFYDADGAETLRRPSDSTLNTVSLWRWYYYDGLGRMSGYRYATWNQSWGLDLHYDPDHCRYDADGQQMLGCDNLAPAMAFEGPNPSWGSTGWRYFHAPGVDEPLVALFRSGAPPSVLSEIYFVTDGQGRQIAAAHPNGGLSADDLTSDKAGWQYAGAAKNADGFGADRYQPANLPQVSLFRNRAYDSRTGRWTQEDPIGAAGGINLYQFNGNNPVVNTDPFGLDPCNPPGSCKAVGVAVGAAAGAAVGDLVAGGCAATTGGACLLGAPAIVGVSAGIGSAGGGLVGTVVEHKDALEQVGKNVVNSLRTTWQKIKTAVGLAVGLHGGHQPPKMPHDDPPPPPVKPAPAPPGGGKPDIQIGPDGVPRMKIPSP